MRPWFWLAWSLSGALFKELFHARIEGRENIPPGCFLAVSNHQSFLDPPLAGWALEKEMCFLARKSLWNNPWFGKLISSTNSLPIDQERPDMAGLKRIIKTLKEGKSVLLFPEGARTLDGNLQPGQPGAGLVASKAQVPILPMRLIGPWDAYPPGAKKLKLHPIRVIIGKPFLPPPEHASKGDKNHYQALSDRMMQEIAALHEPEAGS